MSTLQPLPPKESDVSPVQMWILLILSEGPNYGYNVIQRLSEMFMGYWTPKAGTIYPALDKLTERGLISGKIEHREEGPERRYYTITKHGEEALRRGMERWSRMMEHIEAYGERHRAIRRFKAKATKGDVGDYLQKLGASLKDGAFDLSNAIPSIEPVRVEISEPLEFKFLYAHEDGGLEIEIELEWTPKKETINRK